MNKAPPAIDYKWDGQWTFGRIPTFAEQPMNLLLTERERRLFIHYAMQAPGKRFAPSATAIERATGITTKHLYETRRGLQRKGFIRIEADSLTLDWQRIERMNDQFATSRTPPDSGGITDIPKSEGIFEPTIGELIHGNHRRRKIHHPLEKLTVGEYQAAVSAFAQWKPPEPN